MKREGVEKQATARIWFWTMAIDVCLIFNVGRRLFFNVFPFPVCKAQLIGDWLANRRRAPNCTYIYRVPHFLSPRRNWDSTKRVCNSPQNQKGTSSPAGDGLGKSQFRWLVKSLALCLLCVWNHPSANSNGVLIYWRTDVPPANRHCWPDIMRQYFFS